MRSLLQPPEFVDTEDGLGSMLRALDDVSVIALDCEMSSFWSYAGRVCLVQVSDGEREWIVDPLSVDIAVFGPLCADPDRVKIFHDAEFDVRQLKRDYGFTFQAIFDTRAASAVLGCTTPGLASVLKDRFEVVLSKKLQRADWTQRPLTDEARRYAQLDVAYLHELRKELIVELQDAGRLPILETEHRRLQTLPPLGAPYALEDYGRIKGSARLDGHARRRLCEVYRVRDEIARAWDRAPFRVLGNQVLMEIATTPPSDVEELMSKRGFPKRRASEVARQILEGLNRAASMTPIERNPKRRDSVSIPRKDQERYDAVRSLRAAYAAEHTLDGSLVLQKAKMVRLAIEPPADMATLAEVLDPWQLEAYGAPLLALLQR